MGEVIHISERRASVVEAMRRDLTYVASSHYGKGARLIEIADAAIDLIVRCLVKMDPEEVNEDLHKEIYNRLMNKFAEELVMDVCSVLSTAQPPPSVPFE